MQQVRKVQTITEQGNAIIMTPRGWLFPNGSIREFGFASQKSNQSDNDRRFGTLSSRLEKCR